MNANRAYLRPVRPASIREQLTHPGRFISCSLEQLNISAEEFAQKCDLDLPLVYAVLSGDRLPDDDFIAKARAVFDDGCDIILAVRDGYKKSGANSALRLT